MNKKQQKYTQEMEPNGNMQTKRKRGFKIMEKTYTYEITENGYYILINGKKAIHQYEPFIPDKSKSYEENAQAQIAEMQEADANVAQEQTTLENLQEQITNLELALAEIYEGGN